MDALLEGLGAFASEHIWTVKHWPFWSWAFIASLLGQWVSMKVFTRPNAYMKRKSQWFWWWGRESLPLHPVAAGFMLGWFWKNPEGENWAGIGDNMYFAMAGFASLFVWVLIRGVYKWKTGRDLVLPGQSEPPAK